VPDWSRIHREKRFGPWTLPLSLFSALYGVGVRLRLSAYTKGIFRGKSLPGYVVSVGNLTAGGTGKTPAVVMLARWLLDQSHRVAVLSRGYGAQYKQEILEVSDGKGTYTDARMAGDEPSLLAREIPGSPVIISRSRYRAGMYAHKTFGSDCFILDDGFQHLGLERDLNLVLIDAFDPFGNGHLLPWGPLREPLHQLRRADAFILTRFSRVQSAEHRGQGVRGNTRDHSAQRTVTFLKGKFPSIPVFCADHIPDKLVFPLSGEAHTPGFLRGKRVLAFAGIAHPEQFQESLIELGADVIQFIGFRDHYRFDGDEIRELIRMKERIGARYLLTTEKDWMRIAPFTPACNDLAYLSVRFAFLPRQEGIFGIIRNGLSG
jgi:tetraacyldisaccharide 4'-kinase